MEGLGFCRSARVCLSRTALSQDDLFPCSLILPLLKTETRVNQKVREQKAAAAV